MELITPATTSTCPLTERLGRMRTLQLESALWLLGYWVWGSLSPPCSRHESPRISSHALQAPKPLNPQTLFLYCLLPPLGPLNPSPKPWASRAEAPPPLPGSGNFVSRMLGSSMGLPTRPLLLQVVEHEQTQPELISHALIPRLWTSSWLSESKSCSCS